MNFVGGLIQNGIQKVDVVLENVYSPPVEHKE